MIDKKPPIDFPKEPLWSEFWRICEVEFEKRMFGWSDRTLPIGDEADALRFDFKLSVKSYLDSFMKKWNGQRGVKDFKINRPFPQHDQFLALKHARENCDGALGTFHYVMRTAWYETHKPIGIKNDYN